MPQFPTTQQSLLVLAVAQALMFQSVQVQAADADRVVAQNGAEASVTGQLIETTGYGVSAMYADSGGKIQSSDMAVTTSGLSAHGVQVHGFGSEFNSSGELSISTTGDGSIGLVATYGGKATVEKIDVATSGDFAAGVFAGSGEVSLGSGSIMTKGEGSAGIWSYMGRVNGAGLQIKTLGKEAVGLQAWRHPAFDQGTFIDLSASAVSTRR